MFGGSCLPVAPGSLKVEMNASAQLHSHSNSFLAQSNACFSMRTFLEFQITSRTSSHISKCLGGVAGGVNPVSDIVHSNGTKTLFPLIL